VHELSRSFKLATVWLVVGVAVFLAVQAIQSQQRRSLFSSSGGVIELRRAADGHYHWPGTVNGVAVDFMIDTGATTTALPRALAERAGLASDGAIRSATAGGEVVGQAARADLALEGGVRLQGARVTVLPALDAPLLGMDVLSRLHWSQQGGVLRMESAATR
jgi:aspartyl protease family protein